MKRNQNILGNQNVEKDKQKERGKNKNTIWAKCKIEAREGK
jgi:hypothetical protein